MATPPTLDELPHKFDTKPNHKYQVVIHQNRCEGVKETQTYSQDLGIGGFGDELSHKLDAEFDYKNRVVIHQVNRNRREGAKETRTYSRNPGNRGLKLDAEFDHKNRVVIYRGGRNRRERAKEAWTYSGYLGTRRFKLDAEFDHKRQVVIHRGGQDRREGVKETWTYSRDLGNGAFGVVWLEKEAVTRQLRAVKRMTILELSSKGVNFKRELQTLIALRGHGSLFVQFFGWYLDENFIYVAMEYIKHGDLEQYIQHYEIQARMNAKEITRQLLEGLVVLHGRHICHRDLKPQNVLIAELTPIRVKLADFGLSKCEKNTNLDTPCGTVGYKAPELLGLLPWAIYRGNVYTNAVDMWALGCLLYQMLTTEVPFLQKPPSKEDLSLSSLSGIEQTRFNTSDYPRLVDISLLCAYCSGKADLPTEILQPRVTNSGLGFCKRLLDPNPRLRMSAEDALSHEWMLKSSCVVLPKDIERPSLKNRQSQDADTSLLKPPPTLPHLLHQHSEDTRSLWYYPSLETTPGVKKIPIAGIQNPRSMIREKTNKPPSYTSRGQCGPRSQNPQAARSGPLTSRAFSSNS